jgi:hypothetical protein
MESCRVIALDIYSRRTHGIVFTPKGRYRCEQRLRTTISAQQQTQADAIIVADGSAPPRPA